MNQSSEPVETFGEQPLLVGFLRELIQSDLHPECRREFRRHSLRTTLLVQPLTEDFRPDGESFPALSSDISLKGMSFVNPDLMTHEYLRIGFEQFEVSMIARVKHNSSIGIKYPLYLVGLEFLDEYYES